MGDSEHSTSDEERKRQLCTNKRQFALQIISIELNLSHLFFQKKELH